MFRIYRSSAGSGKTFTLTKEFLKLALTTVDEDGRFDSGYYKHILAVTFTRDATNEMKQRILQKLSTFATLNLEAGDTDDLLEVILSEALDKFKTAEEGRRLICQRAQLVHEKLLHNYADFSVSTIDSFNQKVIQAFKKDLDLPFNFELELDSKELLEEAVYLLQEQVGEERDAALSELLVEFALNKADDERHWYIDKDLFDFGKNLFNEDVYQVIKTMRSLDLEGFKKIKKQLFDFVASFEENIKELGNKAIELLQQYQIEKEHLSRGSLYNYFLHHATMEEGFHKLSPNQTVRNTFEQDKWLSAKGKKAGVEGALEQIKPELTAIYYAFEKKREDEEFMSQYVVAQQVRKRIFLLATINELDKLLFQLKTEKGVVHISEVNNSIHDLINGEPVPYIYERIGERYRHILIDEFQDTSKMQWHNLVPLLSNALANHCMCLVVGDAKQAIYRWRGGRAEMLVQLPALPTARGTALEQEELVFRQHEDVQNLATNYRSHENVIQFNNAFFDVLIQQLSKETTHLGNYYKEVEQKYNSKKGGEAYVTQIDPQEKDATLRKTVYQEATLEMILMQVEELQQKGYKLSDIAILVRQNKQGVAIAEYLMERKYEVISSESLLLMNAEVVGFLIDFLRLFTTYADASLKMSILRFLKKHQAVMNQEESSSFMQGAAYVKSAEAVLQSDYLKDFFLYLNQVFGYHLQLGRLQFMSLYEMIEELTIQLKLNTLKEQQIYLHKFMETILLFTQKEGNSVQDFLQYWERKKADLSIALSDTGDAIRIMTIHKSKGLEFPAVIMPFVDWSVQPRPGDVLWQPWEHNPIAPDLSAVTLGVSSDLEQTSFIDSYKEEMEAVLTDALNVLYVGLTRAGRYLHVITQEKKLPKTGKFTTVSQFLQYFIERSGKEQDLQELALSREYEGVTAGIHRYTFFEDEEPIIQKKIAMTNTFEIQEYVHIDNKEEIALRSIEVEEGERAISIFDVFSAKNQGIMIHKAFERIIYEEDIEDVVRNLKYEGVISEQDEADFIERMNTVVSLPEIQQYYNRKSGYEILNETELLLKSEEELLSVKTLRPDRLMLKGKEAIVIDYKTGHPEEKYKEQVKKYSRQLKKMGYANVLMFLVYTELPKAVQVFE
ncbi:UvrD-helicase domain-containing protein [Algivirga pacifica]|uniref:DNA 3'-5' helicase n=2 Tax=Algivirga pacifica TaxID=1162670 RepID=A0ABP9DAJ3_9BACT